MWARLLGKGEDKQNKENLAECESIILDEFKQKLLNIDENRLTPEMLDKFKTHLNYHKLKDNLYLFYLSSKSCAWILDESTDFFQFTEPIINNINNKIIKNYENIKEGDKIFIWGINIHNITNKQVEHLTVQIITQTNNNYSFGIIIDVKTCKNKTMIKTMKDYLSKCKLSIHTPDNLFENKIYDKIKNPNYTKIKLIASSILTSKHINNITNIFESNNNYQSSVNLNQLMYNNFNEFNEFNQNTIIKNNYLYSKFEELLTTNMNNINHNIMINLQNTKIHLKNNINFRYVLNLSTIINIKNAEYCAISSKLTKTQNCASFLHMLFGDILSCGGFLKYVVIDPNRCHQKSGTIVPKCKQTKTQQPQQPQQNQQLLHNTYTTAQQIQKQTQKPYTKSLKLPQPQQQLSKSLQSLLTCETLLIKKFKNKVENFYNTINIGELENESETNFKLLECDTLYHKREIISRESHMATTYTVLLKGNFDTTNFIYNKKYNNFEFTRPLIYNSDPSNKNSDLIKLYNTEINVGDHVYVWSIIDQNGAGTHLTIQITNSKNIDYTIGFGYANDKIVAKPLGLDFLKRNPSALYMPDKLFELKLFKQLADPRKKNIKLIASTIMTPEYKNNLFEFLNMVEKQDINSIDNILMIWELDNININSSNKTHIQNINKIMLNKFALIAGDEINQIKLNTGYHNLSSNIESYNTDDNIKLLLFSVGHHYKFNIPDLEYCRASPTWWAKRGKPNCASFVYNILNDLLDCSYHKLPYQLVSVEPKFCKQRSSVEIRKCDESSFDKTPHTGLLDFMIS
jgi:hypothetical protein